MLKEFKVLTRNLIVTIYREFARRVIARFGVIARSPREDNGEQQPTLTRNVSDGISRVHRSRACCWWPRREKLHSPRRKLVRVRATRMTKCDLIAQRVVLCKRRVTRPVNPLNAAQAVRRTGSVVALHVSLRKLRRGWQFWSKKRVFFRNSAAPISIRLCTGSTDDSFETPDV